MCKSIEALRWGFYYVSVFHRIKPPNHNTTLYTAAWLVGVLRNKQQTYREMLFQLSGRHTCHNISLRFCLTPAYCTNHGFGPELERALDSTAVMMESGDRQYWMNDGFFYNLKNTNMDKTATRVVYKTSKTNVYTRK